MNQLVPSGYYSVNPMKGSKLDQLLGLLGELGTQAGSSVNNYAFNQPAGSAQRILLGADPNTQMGLRRGLGKAAASIPGVTKEAGLRFAMSPAAKSVLRVVPGLSVLGAGLSAADIVAGNDSFANKAMDTAAMGIGGALGAVGGPIGIAAGASLGKAASDATQYLFGDKKTPEERRMEEALAALRGGMI